VKEKKRAPLISLPTPCINQPPSGKPSANQPHAGKPSANQQPSVKPPANQPPAAAGTFS